MSDFQQQRYLMVATQLEARGIKDDRVLNAFREIKREEFIPSDYRNYAYEDRPLPIGHSVTISQPYIVALMCQILEVKSTDKILDIGTGSGYQAAILSKLCEKVYTIERIAELAEKAKRLFDKLSLTNVDVAIKDGTDGYEKHAPYNKIIVAAATKEIPRAWIDQLKMGGKIVFPKIDDNNMQYLTEVQKRKKGIIEIDHGGVVFVPLIKGS